MKMRLYLFLLFSVIGLHGIHAQEKFVFGVPSAVRTVFFQPCYIKDSTLVGQADLSVKYRLTRRAGDSLYKWCLLKLMAGDGISSQIDELEYFNSLIMTELNSGTVGVNASLRSKAGMMGDAPSNLFLQMVRRDKEGILEVTGSDMQTINRTRMYKEPVPDIEWTVEEGIDSLYGYPCMKATAQFRGRIWTAWFTTDIPIGLGPWKLAGLPGLILKAMDQTGAYCFECLELSQTREPMYVYDYPNKQTIDRREYLKYEKNCFTMPYELLAHGDRAIIWEKKTDGTVSKVNESWTVPYYPIEFE